MKRCAVFIVAFFLSVSLSAATEGIEYFDTLTGNTYVIEGLPVWKTYGHQFMKLAACDNNATHLVQIYSKKQSGNYTLKDSKKFFKQGRDLGELYKIEKINLKHQKGYQHYYHYKDKNQGNVVVCITVLPGNSILTYILEQAPTEEQLIAKNIVEASDIKHGLFPNHFRIFWIDLFSCILLFVTALLLTICAEEISKSKHNVFSKGVSIALSIIMAVLIIAVCWWNEGRIVWPIILGTIMGTAVFACTWPKEKIRGSMCNFLNAVFSHME